MKRYFVKKSARNETGGILNMQPKLAATQRPWFQRKGNTVLSMAVATVLGGTMISEPAAADDAARQYKIPAQSLNNALMKFAADSNLELIFSADTVRSLNAKALDGTMTPEQALGQLLQGSGYTYRFIDRHTVMLEKATVSDTGAATTLKPMTVKGKRNDVGDRLQLAQCVHRHQDRYADHGNTLFGCSRASTGIKRSTSYKS